MSGRTVFITGTDTGVGKTLASCALISALRASGKRVCGFKPVASGCENGRNADALALMRAAGADEVYEAINPIALPEAIAPHLAAQRAGTPISIPRLREAHEALKSKYDWIVAEGAGGWFTPYDEVWTQAEWVAEMEWPVILVVGLRLGCLNHALLSVEAIRRRTKLAGWIANTLPPAMPACAENIESLRRRIAAPLLGVIADNADETAASAALNVKTLIAAPSA